MKNKIQFISVFSIILVSLLLFSACSSPLSDAYRKLTAAGFSSFGFFADDNIDLADDISMEIDSENTAISLMVPEGTLVTNLIPRFSLAGQSVYVGDEEQRSGITAQNFSEAVVYEVRSFSGTRHEITVTVTPSGTSGTTYTISFHANEANSGEVPTSIIKTEGVEASIPGNTGNLVKDGYTFGGWNIESDGSDSTTYQDGWAFWDDVDTVLYAVWEIDLGPDLSYGDWNILGADPYDTAAPFGAETKEPKLAYDSDGQIYLATASSDDNLEVDYEIDVRVYDGTNWQLAASTPLTIYNSYPTWDFLLLSDGTMVISVRDGDNLTVYRNTDGTYWIPMETLETTYFTGTDELTIHECTMTTDPDDNIYILVRRQGDLVTDQSLSCFIYSQADSSWKRLGADGFNEGRADGGIDIIWDGNTLLAACADTWSAQATVYEYSETGDSWSVKGSANFATGSDARSMVMATDETNTYVALRRSGDLEIYKWGETDWEVMSEDAGTVDTSSASVNFGMIVTEGIPVITFQQTGTSRGKILKWDGDEWVDTVFNGADSISSSSLIYTPAGQLVIAYEDGSIDGGWGTTVRYRQY